MIYSNLGCDLVQLTGKVVEPYLFYDLRSSSGYSSGYWLVYKGALSDVTTEVYTDSGWLIVGPNELSVWED
jgi:hypothetical protein